MVAMTTAEPGNTVLRRSFSFDSFRRLVLNARRLCSGVLFNMTKPEPTDFGIDSELVVELPRYSIEQTKNAQRASLFIFPLAAPIFYWFWDADGLGLYIVSFVFRISILSSMSHCTFGFSVNTDSATASSATSCRVLGFQNGLKRDS
jgi:hypothetical protein